MLVSVRVLMVYLTRIFETTMGGWLDGATLFVGTGAMAAT
jgi:hypothetical protein